MDSLEVFSSNHARSKPSKEKEFVTDFMKITQS